MNGSQIFEILENYINMMVKVMQEETLQKILKQTSEYIEKLDEVKANAEEEIKRL